MHGYTTGVIVPAYNEEDYIVNTLNGIKKIRGISQIIVVDDGSRDSTCYKARQNGVEVVCLGKNKGKGIAIKEGLKIIQQDIILLLDADLGHTAAEAEKMLLPIYNGQADAVIGNVPCVKGKGGFGAVKKLARYGVKKLSGQDFPCVLSGQRAVKREILERVNFYAHRFDLEIGMTIEMLKMGINISTVDVDMDHRRTGKSINGFIHRMHQFMDIYKYINNYKRETGSD